MCWPVLKVKHVKIGRYAPIALFALFALFTPATFALCVIDGPCLLAKLW